jgi:hypothetical protein
MKQWMIAAAVVLLAAAGGMAKEKGKSAGPHPNEKAYEHANEHARFKRDGSAPEKKKNKDHRNKGKSKKDGARGD